MPAPATTRTGHFPIGFRRRGAWQQNTDDLVAWTVANGFAGFDLTGGDLAGDLARLAAAGLRAGSVDLCDWGQWSALLSLDRTQRETAVDAARVRIEFCAAAGVRNFFTLILPEDPARPRREDFARAVESYNALVPTLEAAGARVVIEGWPGRGALCCTPETFRAFFRELPTAALAINYDPSHLVRMGIDPLRFLREFAARVHHVHAKDTLLAEADALYEYGWELPATFAPAPAFGAAAWRYTIPGQGQTDWPALLTILQAVGYQGGVSVELEDASFHGSEDAEKRGLLLTRQFLEGC